MELLYDTTVQTHAALWNLFVQLIKKSLIFENALYICATAAISILDSHYIQWWNENNPTLLYWYFRWKAFVCSEYFSLPTNMKLNISVDSFLNSNEQLPCNAKMLLPINVREYWLERIVNFTSDFYWHTFILWIFTYGAMCFEVFVSMCWPTGINTS